MSDIEFIEGLIVKAPNPKAPEFVKASISIKREALIAWLQSREGEWINGDIKVSNGGKWYCAVNQWKPDAAKAKPKVDPSRDEFDVDIDSPF